MKQISSKGVTVVASIHQPAYPVFAEFEHLLLLDKGRVAYKGAVSDAEAWFKVKTQGTLMPQGLWNTPTSQHDIEQLDHKAQPLRSLCM
eukprot:2043864-Amphidinium_carterae.1